jgi:RNA polymerase sigma factor (sigma-70 family)
MDEQQLIAAAQSGDVNAFNELVLAYQDMAYSVAFRILHDQQSASDATQDAFIKAFRKLHQFEGQYFKAWLLRIVTNGCYDELRRQKRRATDSLDTMLDESDRDSLALEQDTNADLDMLTRFDEPETAIQRQELQRAIEDCLQRLNDTYRVVAVLVDVQGLSYDDVAQSVDVSLGTVKSRLSRARARLRDCLQNYKELLPGQYRLNDTDNA